MTSRCRRVPWLIAAALAVPLALGPAAPATAAWSAVGTGGSAAAASVMPTGSAPSGSAVGSSVTVSWTPVTLTDGASVAGYVITRYNKVTGTPGTVGSACTGIVTTTTCTENSVPPGTWIYIDTPVVINWTGGESPGSAPVVVS